MLQLGRSQQRGRYLNGCTWGTSSPDPHSCSSELLFPYVSGLYLLTEMSKPNPGLFYFPPDLQKLLSCYYRSWLLG